MLGGLPAFVKVAWSY